MDNIMIPWGEGEIEIAATFGAALKLEAPFGRSFAQIALLIEDNAMQFDHWLIMLKIAMDTNGDIKSTPAERRDLMTEEWGTVAIKLTAWFMRCVEPQLKKMSAAASSVTPEGA